MIIYFILQQGAFFPCPLSGERSTIESEGLLYRMVMSPEMLVTLPVTVGP